MVGIEHALARTRLLTLTGAGGSGKTRLAVEAARGLVERYPDGVWLVELASLSGAGMAPQALAAALNIPRQVARPVEAALVDHLEAKDLLLVLDNCEHLVDGVARLAHDLLSACGSLQILATSREVLSVPGETVWTVPPLAVPDAVDTPTVEDLLRCESVRLFVDRARSRQPSFRLDQENARPTARVCRELDGIPLAIELACARMGTLSVDQLSRKLGDSLRLLTGGARVLDPRHQTMRAALQWSHELLPDAEKDLYARLSIFAGGWTLGAAEEVCAGGNVERSAVLDLLGRLADKSLVMVEGMSAEGPRFRMLEPVRQYGRERLENIGGEEQFRERHAEYYLALAERAEPGLVGPAQVAWLERLATEYPNLRAALSWSLDEGEGDRAELGLRLAAASGRFWGNLGSSEGREWLEKGLTRSPFSPAALRAKALNEAGWMAIFAFDQRAVGMIEEALSLYRELGDRSGQASAINHLMHTAGLLGNIGRIPTLEQETRELLREPLGDPRATAYLHLTLGMIAMFINEQEQVTVRMEKALSLFREVGDLWGAGRCLSPMGIAALGRGDVAYAAWANKEALEILRQVKNNIGISTVLIQAAGVAVLRNRPARGARLFAAAQALRRAIGHPDPVLKPLNYDYEALIARSRAELGGKGFEAAFSEGLAMSAEQAVEYALSTEDPAPPARPGGQASANVSSDTLTEREIEVARLVGRGLTNREVGEELSISEHTAAAHVRKILKKLGLRSRVQIPPA